MRMFVLVCTAKPKHSILREVNFSIRSIRMKSVSKDRFKLAVCVLNLSDTGGKTTVRKLCSLYFHSAR